MEVSSVVDTAFGGGTLVLSELAKNLQYTFCGKCYRGIVSAGDAGGANSGERAELVQVLGGTTWTLSASWSVAQNVQSTLVFGATDGLKHESVHAIQNWMRTVKGIDIPNSQVYFFDDNIKNPPSFVDTGYNARMVSCGSRDESMQGVIGFCGGRSDDVVQDAGVLAQCGGGLVGAAAGGQQPAAQPPQQPAPPPQQQSGYYQDQVSQMQPAAQQQMQQQDAYPQYP